MSTATATMPVGEMQFYDAFEPGLKDGIYRIDVSATVSVPGAKVLPVSQTFQVQGPRFTLDPADVHTMFPPNGSTGTFEEVLPHIVFGKRLLPWERDIPGLPDSVPWLALLVFGPGELLGAPGGGNYAQTLTVSQLLATDANTRKPQLDPATLTADDLALSCQAITIGSALFAQLVPTADELPLLAHARQVGTAGKPTLDLKDDGWFSVVVANRFPQAGSATATAASIVHLVSLEGFSDLLGGIAPTAPSAAQVQLVSLASWSFSCLADPSQTFGGLAQNLAYDSTGALRPAASLMLRLPFTPTGQTGPGTQAVQQRLLDGYVALGYHASSGEDGFAWYRGPCPPVVPAPVPGATAFETADAAAIYDPASGVFDLSLATAWQAGRSIALGNPSYATALMRVRIAANAVVEQAAAPPDPHARLAALFAGGALHTVGAASSATAHALAAVAPAPAATPALAAAARPASTTALRALLAQPAVRARMADAVSDTPDALTVAQALGQLLLLRGVPFVHLVPDARMLPPESIRFFYFDPNWLGALVDGALSVGIGTSRESAVQAALTQQLEQMALTESLAWRARQQGLPPLAAATGPTSGFLLRSALASGWPGLGVSATLAGAPVPLLRLEHVGPGVLVALFDGVPDTVVLSEPHEGLEFGVNDSGEVQTRTLASPPTVVSGTAVTVYNPASPTAASVAIRTGGQRVLNIVSDPSPPASAPPTSPLDLRDLLAKTLGVVATTIGPADFAVQMVKGPEQLVFSLQPPAKPV